MPRNFKTFLRTDIANAIVALLIATALFFYVSNSVGSTGGGISSPFGPMSSSNETKEITIPVRVDYDENQYFVTGAPRQITITVKAAHGVITSISNSNSVMAVLDLTNLNIGKHQVNFKIVGVDNKLVQSINPTNATVEIAEGDRKTLPIDADYQRNNLAEGVTEQSFSISTNQATVIGSKSQIATVSQIVAFMDIPQNTDSNRNDSVALQALDANGNPVDGVQISPSSVTARLTVNNSSDSDNENASAQVPITINPINGDASLFSIVPNLQVANISGSEANVNAISTVVVTVDLSTVALGTPISYSLTANNVVVDPKMVEITVAAL